MTRFYTFPALASQWVRPRNTMRLKRKWFGNIRIPEGRSGNHAVQHRSYPPGSSFPLSSTRTSIFGGHSEGSITSARSVIVHELVEFDGDDQKGVWMTDLPIEQAQIDPLIAPMHGRVLVGGLGLGYAAQQLAMRDSVSEVVVIEKSSDVISLVEPHLRGSRTKREKSKIRVVHADLHDWLKSRHLAREVDQFDWAFYDIWAPDGDRVLFQHVVPLRAWSVGTVPNENVRCWNEDVMRGQLLVGLKTRLLMLRARHVFPEVASLDELCAVSKGDRPNSTNFAIPLFEAVRDGRVSLDDACGRVSEEFVANYGIPGRESTC